MLEKTKKSFPELLKKVKKLIPILRSSGAVSVYKELWNKFKQCDPTSLVEFLTALLLLIVVVVLFVVFIHTMILF